MNDFSESKAAVQIAGYLDGYIYTDELMTEKKYGLVGLDGRERMEPVFDYVHGIEDDYVLVSNIVDGQWKYGVIKIVE